MLHGGGSLLTNMAVDIMLQPVVVTARSFSHGVTCIVDSWI
jgi:hypothetical protein